MGEGWYFSHLQRGIKEGERKQKSESCRCKESFWAFYARNKIKKEKIRWNDRER